MQDAVVIVDAFSAGNLFAPAFKEKGIITIHILSKTELPQWAKSSFRPETFDRLLSYEGNLALLISSLSKYQILGVIPGCETGVPLADQLSEILQVKSNGCELSHCRRDKFEMNERIRNQGIRSVEQFATSELSLALHWYEHYQLKQAVVKPVNSAGTDSVFFCENKDQVSEAVIAILGTRNQLGLINERVVIQERLTGTEYAVNTVSLNGRTILVGMWRYHKTFLNGRWIYDFDELVSSEDPVIIPIFNYVVRVVAALGISYGCAHTEVIVDKNGPILVESASRIDGVTNPIMDRKTVGYGQLDAMVAAYAEPEIFSQFPDRFTTKAYLRNVFLMNKVVDAKLTQDFIDKLSTLRSFHGIKMKQTVGATLPLTIDIFSSAGIVTLHHEDQKVVASDYEKLREWEGLNSQASLHVPVQG